MFCWTHKNALHCKIWGPTGGKTLQKMNVAFPQHSKRIGPRKKTLSKNLVFHSINKLLKPLQLTAKPINQTSSSWRRSSLFEAKTTCCTCDETVKSRFSSSKQNIWHFWASNGCSLELSCCLKATPNQLSLRGWTFLKYVLNQRTLFLSAWPL